MPLACGVGHINQLERVPLARSVFSAAWIRSNSRLRFRRSFSPTKYGESMGWGVLLCAFTLPQSDRMSTFAAVTTRVSPPVSLRQLLKAGTGTTALLELLLAVLLELLLAVCGRKTLSCAMACGVGHNSQLEHAIGLRCRPLQPIQA